MKQSLLFVSFFSLTIVVSAQMSVSVSDFANQTNIFAPAPNAAALGKYGEIPVNDHTGIPNISVPIYSWKSTRSNIQVDVNLGYHAGGNKVEDIASSVGLGWSLNAYASITRNVRGLPDDYLNGYLNTDPLPNFNTPLYTGDYYDCPPALADEYVSMDTGHLSIIAPFNTPQQTEYTEMYMGLTDGEQDMFYYSVGQISGKFVLDKEGTVQKLDYNNYRIIPLYSIDGSGTKTITGFKIISDNGITYNLTEEEASTNYTSAFTTYSPTQFDNQMTPQPGATSTFYVKTIVDSLSKDTVFFDYNIHDIAYQNGFGEAIEYHDNNDPDRLPATTINRIYSQAFSYNTNFTGQLAIREIRCSDHSKINFYYENARLDLKGDSALTRIVISDYLDNKKQYKLRYGYFDADGYILADWTNTPTAVIETYTPTSDHFNKRLKLTAIDWFDSDGSDSIQYYQFEYNSIELPARNSKAIDFWGYFVGPDRSSYTLIPQLQTVDNIPSTEGLQSGYSYSWLNFYLEGADRRPDSNYAKAAMLTKITYPTKGYTQFEYASNTVPGPIYFNSLKRSHKVTQFLDGTSGRKFVSFINRADTGVNFVVNFSRVNPDGTLYDPPYHDPNAPFECFDDAVSQHTITMTVRNFDGSVIKTADFAAVDSGYGLAWIYFKFPYEGACSISYTYNDDGDQCADSAYFNMETVVNYIAESDNDLVGGLRIKSITNSAEVNGTLEKTVYNYNDDSGQSTGYLPVIPNNSEHRRSEACWSTYDPEAFPVFKGHAHFKSRTSGTTQTLGYSFGSNIGYARVEKSKISVNTGIKLGKTVTTFSTPIVRNNYDVYPYKNIQFIDWASGHPLEESVYDQLGKMTKKTSHTYLDEIDTFFNDNNRSIKLALLRTDRSEVPAFPVTFRRYVANTYYPINGFSRPLSQREVYFGKDDSLVIVTKYKYDGYQNISTVNSVSSNGDSTELIIHYPYNFSTTPMSKLLSANNFGLQISTQNVLYSGALQHQIGGSAVDYSVVANSAVKPTKFYKYNSTMPTDIFGVSFNPYSVPQGSYDNLEGEITKYDDYGNILEMISKDGVPTSVVYGYQYTRPVAKITGAKYEHAIEKFSSVSISSLQAITDPSTLREKLDELRQGYADSNMVQVTSYTYVPLFGIESQTDQRGKTLYYEYDGFGRLRVVRDQDSLVVKRICYNYAGQPEDCQSPTCDSSSCSGDDKKCINGHCETGTEVCDGVFKVGFQWFHYYHYEWSDETVSPTYTGDGKCGGLE